eukprot:743952-Prymnesium_polylepis.1
MRSPPVPRYSLDRARAAPYVPFFSGLWSMVRRKAVWPMAYDAPGGGIGRYARPACGAVRGWHEVRVDARTVR